MSQDTVESIECRLSWWFHKRAIIFVAIIGGMSAYFVYDGYIGYPKGNLWVDEYEAFDADSAGTSWGRYAAKHNRPAAPPERHTDAEILQQKQIGFTGFAITLLSGLWWWRKNQKKWLIFPGDKFITPKGKEVGFDQVEATNFKKWDYGVAFLTCGEAGRVRVDDYVYQGLDQLVDCLRDARPDLELPQTSTVAESAVDQDSEASS